jgi:PST family polysaccharide transporter
MYVVQFSSYFMPLLTLPYLSRVLGPEKFGLVAYAQAFMWYFVTLTEYSFNLTATRRIAAAQGDPEEISKTFSAVMASKLLLTVLGLAILLATVFALPKLRPNWNLFLVCFLSVVGNCLFPLWLFQGLQKMEHVAIRDFLAKLIGIGALFALVHRDSDYLLAASVQSGSLIVAGLIGLASVPFLSPVRWRWPSPRYVWDTLRTGWPVFLPLAASSFTVATNIFILGLRSSNEEVAYFSGAWRIVSALRMLVAPVVTAVYPHVSHKAGRSEREVVQFVRKYGLLLAGPFLLLGLVLLVAGPLLIRIALGRQYGPSMLLIQVMALSPFLLALSHLFSTYYMLACGYDKAWMRVMLLSVAVNFLTLFPLLHFIAGSLALAITSMVTDCFCVVMYWMFYQKHATRGDGESSEGLPVPADVSWRP